MTRKLQTNNTSGISGIRFVWLSSKGGRAYPYVQASWYDKGLCNTQYSVTKHGPIKATELALEARGQHMGSLGLSARQVWARIKPKGQ